MPEPAKLTQKEALEKLKAMFPEKAPFLSAERDLVIGYRDSDRFYLWDHSGAGHSGSILASSSVGWEHALALVAATMNVTPTNATFEDEGL